MLLLENNAPDDVHRTVHPNRHAKRKECTSAEPLQALLGVDESALHIMHRMHSVLSPVQNGCPITVPSGAT